MRAQEALLRSNGSVVISNSPNRDQTVQSTRTSSGLSPTEPTWFTYGKKLVHAVADAYDENQRMKAKYFPPDASDEYLSLVA